MIRIENISRSFTLHNQGGTEIPVLQGATLRVATGECVAPTGPYGAGKSTLMQMIYGHYLAASDSICVGELGVAKAAPRDILTRRHTLGYVSQFLRVVPRVPTGGVVVEPLLAVDHDPVAARHRAEHLLASLNIPKRLWGLSPKTFSGGEQQRVNIARGSAYDYPALLLDEPTASFEPADRATDLSVFIPREAA